AEPAAVDLNVVPRAEAGELQVEDVVVSAAIDLHLRARADRSARAKDGDRRAEGVVVAKISADDERTGAGDDAGAGGERDVIASQQVDVGQRNQVDASLDGQVV